MKCKKCGYEMTGDMNFCPICGKRQLPNGETLKNMFRDGGWEPDVRVEKSVDSITARKEWEEKFIYVWTVCRAFLDWAEDWMEENPDGSVYCRRARGLLTAMDAENDAAYICCDVNDDRQTGFAVTNEGITFLDDGDVTSFSFTELADLKVLYCDGDLEIGEDCCIDFLSAEEARRLFKLLRIISLVYETDM